MTEEMIEERKTALALWRHLNESRELVWEAYVDSVRNLRIAIYVEKKMKRNFLLRMMRIFSFIINPRGVLFCLSHRKTYGQIAMHYYWKDKHRWIYLKNRITQLERIYEF